MTDFKVQDLAFKVDVLQGRVEALVQLHHREKGVIAQADLITCGHTNPIGNGPAGGIEFDVRFNSKAQFRKLREALREMLKELDSINVLGPDEP